MNWMMVEKFLRRDFDPLIMIMTSFIDSFTTVVQVSTIYLYPPIPRRGSDSGSTLVPRSNLTSIDKLLVTINVIVINTTKYSVPVI